MAGISASDLNSGNRLARWCFDPKIALLAVFLAAVFGGFWDEPYGDQDFAYLSRVAPEQLGSTSVGEVNPVGEFAAWLGAHSPGHGAWLRLALHTATAFLLIAFTLELSGEASLALWAGFFFAFRSAHWGVLRWLEGTEIALGGFLLLLGLWGFLRWRRSRTAATGLFFAGVTVLAGMGAAGTREVMIVFAIALVALNGILMEREGRSLWASWLLVLSACTAAFSALAWKLSVTNLAAAAPEGLALAWNDRVVSSLKAAFDFLFVRRFVVVLTAFEDAPGSYFYLTFYLGILLFILIQTARRIHIFALALFFGQIVVNLPLRSRFEPMDLYAAMPGVAILYAALFHDGLKALFREPGGEDRLAETSGPYRLQSLRYGLAGLGIVIVCGVNVVARMADLEDTPPAIFAELSGTVVQGVQDIYPELPDGALIFFLRLTGLKYQGGLDGAFRYAYRNPNIEVYALKPDNASLLYKIRERGTNKVFFFEYAEGNVTEQPEVRTRVADSKELERLIEVIRKG